MQTTGYHPVSLYPDDPLTARQGRAHIHLSLDDSCLGKKNRRATDLGPRKTLVSRPPQPQRRRQAHESLTAPRKGEGVGKPAPNVPFCVNVW